MRKASSACLWHVFTPKRKHRGSPFYAGKKGQLPKINNSSHSLQGNTCGERSFTVPMCQRFYLLSDQLRK